MIKLSALVPAQTKSNPKAIVDAFHKLYMESAETWQNTHWLGVRAFKCPLDMWIYQELLFEQRPDLIVECGTCLGGSALFLASVCDLIGHGRVVTIDIDPPDGKPTHPRLSYLQGSSTSDSIVTEVKRRAASARVVMVILDSDHRKEHVLKELEIYSGIATVGSYLIVEDTNINGHPVSESFGPGPMEALLEFLEKADNFSIDRSREKFLMSFNPKGYLRRTA